MCASIPISQLGFLDTTGVCTHLRTPVFYKPHRELVRKMGFMGSKSGPLNVTRVRRPWPLLWTSTNPTGFSKSFSNLKQRPQGTEEGEISPSSPRGLANIYGCWDKERYLFTPVGEENYLGPRIPHWYTKLKCPKAEDRKSFPRLKQIQSKHWLTQGKKRRNNSKAPPQRPKWTGSA